MCRAAVLVISRPPSILQMTHWAEPVRMTATVRKPSLSKISLLHQIGNSIIRTRYFRVLRFRHHAIWVRIRRDPLYFRCLSGSDGQRRVRSRLPAPPYTMNIRYQPGWVSNPHRLISALDRRGSSPILSAIFQSAKLFFSAFRSGEFLAKRTPRRCWRKQQAKAASPCDIGF